MQTFSVFQDVQQIAHTISSIDAPVVLLKGPVLAQSVFQSSSVRMCDDVEPIALLTSVEHIPALVENLRSIGYMPLVEEANGEFRDIAPEYVVDYGLLVARKVKFLRVGAASSQARWVELHPSEIALADVDFPSVVASSEFNSVFGSSLRVPTSLDMVMHLAFEFYRFYRCKNQLGQLANTVHRGGALRDLADLYACIASYMASHGQWRDLVARAGELSMCPIVGYALYYLGLVFGKGTVPEEVNKALTIGEVVRTSVACNNPTVCACLEDLLRPNIETARSTIPALAWVFDPLETCERISEELRAWKAEGRPYASATCLSLEGCGPRESFWARTEPLHASTGRVGASKFFWGQPANGRTNAGEELRAEARLLWNRTNVYVRIEVVTSSCDCPPLQCGAQVVLYFSDAFDERMPIKRVGVAIGKGRTPVRASLPAKQSYGCAEICDIPFENLSVSVRSGRQSCLFEFEIPWKHLKVTPTCGISRGFDFEVVCRRTQQEPEIVLTWAGAYGLSMFEPAVHGTLKLLPSHMK